MTVTIDLTPALADQLRERATQEGRDEADILRAAIQAYLDPVLNSQPTVGAKLLATWEAEGILGLWQDRPEDSTSLARKLRQQAETR